MKKLISIFILVLVIHCSLLMYVNAWWYNNWPVSYSNWWWSNWTCTGGNDTWCYWETIPNVTICPPNSTNTRSAVWWTSPSPVFSDDTSDNITHDWDFAMNVAESWNMDCFYWDSILFDINTYTILDWNFADFWIADWTEKKLEIMFDLKRKEDGILHDIRLDNASYWIKTIDFTFEFQDKTYLDQYKKTWTAVESVNSLSDDSVWITRTVIYNIDSSNLYLYSNWLKTFEFKYKFYNSTFWVNWFDSEDFKINNIKYNVILNWWAAYSWEIYKNWCISKVSDLAIKVKPLYVTEIISDINEQWFLPNVTQTWSLEIIKNDNTFSWDSNAKLHLEFWSGSNHWEVWSLDLEIVDSSISLPEWHDSSWDINNRTFSSSISNWLIFSINSFISQFSIIWILNKLYLSSHISFDLPDWNWWTKQVVYNSNILWMDNYWWDFNLSSFQKWLKVIWIIHSPEQTDIIQEQADLNIFWKITKASLVKEIRSNAFSIIKNLVVSTDNSIISNIWWTTWNNPQWTNAWNILYFWDLNWANVELLTSTKVEWKKTILLVGGNLYITSDIINDTNSDILWIIVLKDENNKWWNVYIDPGVIDINAVIYADKTLISYNWVDEMDWTFNQDSLSNQLYIHGSVFSNNTIWWAVQTPAICPFYAEYAYSSFSCTKKIAQKFDLNFLRRYYPSLGWTSSVNTNESNPVVIKYNPVIQISPPPLFDK